MLDLNINDITVGSGSLTGNGAFDVFMQACKAHLNKEYADGRITGDKYAEAYIAMMQAVLQAANQFAVSKVTLFNQRELSEEEKKLLIAQADKARKEIEQITANIQLINSNKTLTDQKKVTEEAQTNDNAGGKVVTGTVGKQKEVYSAQIKGFKDDALQKAAKMLVETWSVRRSTDTDGTLADGTNKLYDVNVGKAVKALGDSVGISGL